MNKMCQLLSNNVIQQNNLLWVDNEGPQASPSYCGTSGQDSLCLGWLGFGQNLINTMGQLYNGLTCVGNFCNFVALEAVPALVSPSIHKLKYVNIALCCLHGRQLTSMMSSG